MTEAKEHRYFDEIRARCSNAVEKARLLMVRRMNRKAKKTDTKCVQVVVAAVDWPLAFELGDLRCGGDTWISDR